MSFISPPSPELTKNLYRPLADDSIRILKLEGTCLVGDPATGPRDLAIKCSLQHTSFSDIRQGRVSYHALSYVWGSPKLLRWIVCDGFARPVTANLYNALWQLTFDHHQQGPGYPQQQSQQQQQQQSLWVDAVCMNQDDLEEKSRQVAMMGEIYSEAQKVIVWLGTYAGVAGPGLDEFWRFWSSRSTKDESDDESDDSSDDDYDNEHAAEAGQAFILSSNWFHRVWTFQEITLARKAEVRCGPWRVDWERFCQLASVDSSIVAVQQTMRDKEHLYLLDLIGMTQDRNAGDARDQVYSLLALWHNRQLLKADYTKSKQQVYADTVCAVAQEEGYLWLNIDNIAGLLWANEAWDPESSQMVLWHHFGTKATTWIPDIKTHDTKSRRPAEFKHVNHPDFTINVKVNGTLLTARGVLLGFWSRYECEDDKDRRQYDGSSGVFEGFPPCIDSQMTGMTRGGAKVRDGIFGEGDLAPAFFDPAEIFELLHFHVNKTCACVSAQTPDERPEQHSAPGFDISEHKFAWLCHLFGNETLFVVCPRFCKRTRMVQFALVNKLPDEYHWCNYVDALRTETGRVEHGDKAATMFFGYSADQVEEMKNNWKDHVERIDLGAKCKLWKCRLSWIPTHFEIVDDLEAEDAPGFTMARSPIQELEVNSLYGSSYSYKSRSNSGEDSISSS